jgi:hypothetical protein
MTLIPLDLTTLGQVDDGRIAIAFEQELKRAVFDCRDRPADKKPRIISIEATITPMFNTNTMCADHADVKFKIKSKLPTRESQGSTMQLRANDMLVFSDTSADVRQTTLDDVDVNSGKVDRKEKSAGG